MIRDKSSRVRRHSRPRHNNARSGNTTNKERDSEDSSENEISDHPKSTPVIKKERNISSSSVKSSRRQSKQLKNSNESEIDDEGGDSTYTKYESGSNDENIEVIDTVRKVEDFLESTRSNDQHDSDSLNYNESSKRDKKRKAKKKREKNRSLDSNRAEDEEAYDSKHEKSSERDLSHSERKKSSANISRKSRRKRHRSRGNSTPKIETEEKELPITEILRKAQENPKPRYEEPLPLVELTTDRIYVQGRNGFNAVKIPGDRSNGIFNRRILRIKGPPLYPIKVAIVGQKIWNITGFIHQGVLAGMALMHFLLMQTFFRLSLDFLENYTAVSEYYTNIFSYLVTMCVISVFDRFDLAQLNMEHFREIYVEHSRSFLAVPLYVATFCLHQTNLAVDNNISLINYPRNATEMENNFTGIIVEEDLTIWQKVTLAKDSLAVLAWLFVALGPREDMLLTHLEAMEKYVEIPENST